MLNNRFFQTQLNLKKIGVRVNIKARRTLHTCILKKASVILLSMMISSELFLYTYLYFTLPQLGKHNTITSTEKSVQSFFRGSSTI